MVKVKGKTELKPLKLTERGELETVRGIAHVSHLPKNISHRMKRTACLKLVDYPSVYVLEEHFPQDMDPAFDTGAGIVLWGHFENTILGESCLGERGLPAEKVAQIAVDELLKELSSSSTLDVYACDQLLPFMAMAEGESEFFSRELSNHAKTNMWLIERFLKTKFQVEHKENIEKIVVTP
jgi:RNA 3'-terminal phosphate cyclase